MQSYGILVNTTDSFEDCWNPFFTLFSRFWPSFPGKLYLNTETKTFAHPGLDITSIKNGLAAQSWSDCLLAGLAGVEEDNVFYLQEDYFLYAPVNTPLLADLYGLFLGQGLDCLHVTGRSTGGPLDTETFSPLVCEVLPGASYRISLQPAFWKKTVLSDLLKPGKRASRFEFEANREPETQPAKVYCTSGGGGEGRQPAVFPYVCTGVLGGKWNRAVKSVFRENGLVADYGRRGFYRPKGTVEGWSYRAKWVVKDVLDRGFGYRWRL